MKKAGFVTMSKRESEILEFFSPDESLAVVTLTHEIERGGVFASIYGTENGCIHIPASVLLDASHEVSKLLLDPRDYEGPWLAQVVIKTVD